MAIGAPTVNERGAAGDPVAAAVLVFVGRERDASLRPAALLVELEGVARQLERGGDPRGLAAWPANARALSARLRQLAPFLAGEGVAVSFARSHGARLVRLRGANGQRQEPSAPRVPQVVAGVDAAHVPARH